MKNILFKKYQIKSSLIKLLLLLSIFNFTLTSCSLRAIPTEIPYKRVDVSNIDINSLGNGKILFYNYGYYCPIMSCGWTTKLNIKMNGVSLGQINYGEYFIIEIEKGEYEFQLTHKDVINIKTTLKLKVDENTKIIQSIPKPLSNSITITNQIPADFYLFRQVK